MKQLLFASTNKDKIREVQAMLPDYNILSLLDFPEIQDVDETASTLVGNATLKAVEIATQVDMPVFSDDSGVFIDAMDGFPGVHSARWTGTHRDYASQNEKILDLMKDQTNRKAEYKTVIAFAHNNKITLFEGNMPLEVAHHESQAPGFSYDTIMKFNDTFVSEMNPVDKNKVSSRAKALAKFKEFIANYQL